MKPKGLLDFIQTPAGMGLLSAVASYAVNAQRGTPVNNIGRGLAGGLMGFAGAKEQIKSQQENALTQQYKKLQMDEISQKMAAQKDQLAWKAGLPEVMAQARPGAFSPDNPFDEDLGMLVKQGDPQAVRDYMMRPESPYVDDLIKQQIMPETIVVGRTLKDKRTGETLGYDETWKDEQATNRAQRIEELNMRLQDQQLSREQSAALRREIAEQQMALRRDIAGQQAASQRESLGLRRDMLAQGAKPQFGWRYRPDGSLEPVPGGPGDMAAQARDASVNSFEVSLASLSGAFDQLERGGGISNVDKGALSNIGAFVSSSPPGQLAGRAVGSRNQSARNVIEMTRPGLVNSFMQATGMSSKAIDSNAELKLWLTTAGDPTLDVQANREILDNIRKKFIYERAKRAREAGDLSVELPEDPTAKSMAKAAGKPAPRSPGKPEPGSPGKLPGGWTVKER